MNRTSPTGTFTGTFTKGGRLLRTLVLGSGRRSQREGRIDSRKPEMIRNTRLLAPDYSRIEVLCWGQLQSPIVVQRPEARPFEV